MSSIIIPTLRYNDAAAAIDWLCAAFGFERHLVVEGDHQAVLHAQLSLDNAMIMIGQARDEAFDRLQKTPLDLNGVNTQSAYIVVEDIAAHFARASSAGADIVFPPEAQDYGGSLYCCRDFEGYLWNFGTYNPWRD